MRPGLLARRRLPRDQARHVDLPHQVEVRRRRPRRGHPLRHDPPHRAHTLSPLGRGQGEGAGSKGCGGRCGNRRNIRHQHGAPRPRPAHRAQIHPALRRQPPRLRRRRDQLPRRRAIVAASLPALHEREHVGLLDLARRGLDAREVHAVLLGDAAGQRGGLDTLDAGPLTLPSPPEPLALPSPRGEGEAEEGASPAAAMRAMVWPTGTTSPSCAVTLVRMPEAGASISTVTLSVSISTMGSPFRTVSPGALIQRRTLPVSCASSSAGMITVVGISRAPPARAARRAR